jgi:steroid delta-isomerase-like uncharacterized protein
MIEAQHGALLDNRARRNPRTAVKRMTGASANDATLEENKAVIRRFVEEVQNEKNEEVYDELNDPEFVNLSAPPGAPTDREGGKVYLFGLLNAFPDCRFTIDDMVAEGDQVVTKKTFRGTHTAKFAGLPPTGKTVELQFVDIMRVRNGRIVEHWNCIDQLSFMQQLGVIPSS